MTQKNTRKIWLFRIAMLLLPIVLLLFAEVVLRLFGYGGQEPLFVQKKVFEQTKKVVNTKVATRYFNLPPEVLPEASEDAFSVNKPQNVKRIFCVGGSTTAGFPYEINATFPFQLQQRLSRNSTDQYEVVNLGISAVNSFTVLDLMPEILSADPDAIIIYMGHNEFYGALGVASSQSRFDNRWMKLVALKLQKYALYQFLSAQISVFTSSATETSVDKSLMAQMANGKEVSLNDELFEKAKAVFKENLEDILELAQKKNVPVVLSTLVSNLRDHQPFISKFDNSLSETEQNRLANQLLEAKAVFADGDFETALKIIEKISAVSISAELTFLQGRIYHKLGNYSEAKKMFTHAKELDLLRFRAPEVFNDIIREASNNENAILLDFEEILQNLTPDGIPGNEWFTEHLHPNFSGYQLMASAFYGVIRKTGILKNESFSGKVLFTTDELAQLEQLYQNENGGVTTLDLEFGQLKTHFLTRRWPFVNLDNSEYVPIGDSLTHSLAVAHLQKGLYWDAAHYELADAYFAADSFAKGAAELDAVRIAFPENPIPEMRLGDAYSNVQDLPNALKTYRASLNKSPENPFILAKYGQTLTLMNDFKLGEEFLELALEKGENELVNAQKVQALYLLGLSKANLRKFDEAIISLNTAINLQSSYAPAIQLLENIKVMRSQLQK